MIISWGQPTALQSGGWARGWFGGVVQGAAVVAGLVRMLFRLNIVRRFQVRLGE